MTECDDERNPAEQQPANYCPDCLREIDGDSCPACRPVAAQPASAAKPAAKESYTLNTDVYDENNHFVREVAAQPPADDTF